MKLIFRIFLMLLTSFTFAQNNFWTVKSADNLPEEDIINYDTEVSNFSTFELDEALFINTLKDAPLRFQQNSSNVLISVPYSETKTGIFEMFEVQTLSSGLATKYPGIKSYVGKQRGLNSDRIRVTITPLGIYAKIFSSKGSVYINPMTKTAPFYKVFNLKDAVFPEIQCDFEELLENQTEASSSTMSSSENLVDDSTLRTFRFAVSTTGEYSQFHVNQAGLNSGTNAQKKAAVLAAITVSVDRVNGILENDLSVNLILVPNNDTIIFLDPATDPYTDASTFPSNGTYLNEVNALIPGAIGDANYDIGHLLTTRGGGVAFIGSVCNNNIKAGAVSGSPSPIGDGIDLTFAHEIGHQLGASHTFNNSCGGNRSNNSVYETGSGVTIMAYGSTGCQPNVQGFDFDYYHAGSLLQMFNNIDNIFCAQTTTISNNPPTLVPQTNYTIPKRTPFFLEADATDTDNDILTYNWEQFDNEISPQPPTSSSNVGPNFRNFQPTTIPFRYFPKMETLLNNQIQTTWEVLPNVVRDMNFIMTVRDNNIVGGQNVQDLVSLNVADAGPFKVTSQNQDGIVWDLGDVVTVTWDVAGTDANGINASEVDIIISTNGGLSFDEVLLANTPNDGSQDIVVPSGIIGEQCRLMVKASDNIFFALNENFFNINATCSTEQSTSSVNVPDGLGFNSPAAGIPGESTISVFETSNVSNFLVNVDFSHNRLKDVDIELEAPDGTIAQLWSKDLCNSSDMDVTFIENGTPLPSSDCNSPLTGLFQPLDSFDVFENINPFGDWTLRVTDYFVANSGVINSWSLEYCQPTTLSNDSFTSNDFKIYPNPAQDVLNIELKNSGKTDIKIFDINGRLVKDFNGSDSLSRNLKLEISDITSGVYLINIKQNNKEITKKLIIR